MGDTCLKCGSEKIIPVAKMVAEGGRIMKALIETNPEAWLMKGSVTSSLGLKICGECGYTELMTIDSARLYDEYLKGQAREFGFEQGR